MYPMYVVVSTINIIRYWGSKLVYVSEQQCSSSTSTSNFYGLHLIPTISGDLFPRGTIDGNSGY